MVDHGDRGGPRQVGAVTVLAVDDHDYFRDVMCQVVGATDGFELVGEAASGEAALEAVEQLSPTLVIMDERMPGIGGIEACRLLAEQHPDTLVVITSVEQPRTTTFADSAAVFVQKQELSPRFLRELWDENRVPA